MSLYLRKHAVPLFFLVSISFIGSAQKLTKKELLTEISKRKKIQNFSAKDTTYLNLLNKLAIELRYYKPDSSLIVFNQILKNSKSTNFKIGKGNALLGIGTIYSDAGNSDKAIAKYLEALKTANTTNNDKLPVLIKNNLGEEYLYMGNYAKALNIFLLAIEEGEKIDYKSMLSVLSENVAALYFYQEDFESALAWYKKVIIINKEIGDAMFMAESLSNLASVHLNMKNYELALLNINKSITVFEKNQELDWLAYSYGVKANIYLKQNKNTWAIYWYKQANLLHKKIDDERGRIDILNGLAKAHLAKQNTRIAKTYALEAFDVAVKIKALKRQKECSNTLYLIEKELEDYNSALKYHEVFKNLSDTLSKDKAKKSLAILKNKMEFEKEKENLVISNKESLEKQKGYTTAALIILAILIITIFSIVRNSKIQKRLNSELNLKKDTLEQREMQLNGINKTKDKLFSIIGHDLRGPVGALQSLLKLFNRGDVKKDELLAFIPKLNHDIDHIAFTLNNLLSWGQTQMNGTITRPSKIALKTIVKDNISLLKEIAENKSIKIINKVSKKSKAWSDENQIDIVIRNLISNALKFTPNNGMVTIAADEKNDFWVISVNDTGIGITKEAKEKLFTESSNRTTYGTNNEKGTGLGLSLCKEMVGNNGGEIWIESLPNKGATFYFTLPKHNA